MHANVRTLAERHTQRLAHIVHSHHAVSAARFEVIDGGSSSLTLDMGCDTVRRPGARKAFGVLS
jgi:hypothetical protein